MNQNDSDILTTSHNQQWEHLLLHELLIEKEEGGWWRKSVDTYEDPSFSEI